MYQDSSGRWVSDDGRYVWNGSEWIDVLAQASATATRGPGGSPASATPGPTASGSGAGGPAAAAGPIGPGSASSRTFVPGSTASGSTASHGPDTGSASARTSGSGAHPRRGRRRAPRSRRPLLLLGGLLALVAVGVAAVLLVGRSPSSRPTSATPSPATTPNAPPASVGTSGSPQDVDGQQRRARAEAALLHRPDLPGATEERRSNPTDVFLPCRAVPLTPAPGSPLLGQRVSNSDFSVYAGQTIAAYPSAREASDALAGVRRTLGRCGPYDFAYANSPRIDHVTHSQLATDLAVGDGGVYLEETDVPANYTGSTTAYSYGYITSGQFLVRLTLTENQKPNRPEAERLLRLTVDRLR